VKAPSGARTVSGLRAIMKPVSGPTTRPAPVRSTKSQSPDAMRSATALQFDHPPSDEFPAALAHGKQLPGGNQSRLGHAPMAHAGKNDPGSVYPFICER
jgi:hypothetical protein